MRERAGTGNRTWQWARDHAYPFVVPLIAVCGALFALQLYDEVFVDAALKPSMALAGAVSAATLITIGIILSSMRREVRAGAAELAGAGAALRDSEQRFRGIFAESPLGIVLEDTTNQRIVQANPAFCRMLGYEASELIGKTMPEVTHVDDVDALNGDRGASPQPRQSVEMRHVTRTGAIAWTQVSATSFAQSHGHTLQLRLVADITGQKQAEAELREAQKMEAIGQLTGGIAHDFNNLLGVIIGNVEFLLDAVKGDPEQAALSREILDSALSGADLTRRLLAFARQQSLLPQTIDLREYLPSHIAILRRVLGHSIRVTTNVARDLWQTRVDPSQIGNALLNLTINARDAMPSGGTILIEAANVVLGERDVAQHAGATAGEHIVLSVTDSGTGMSHEVLRRAVEPFFTTKAVGAGSGLGLSMIYGFARQSGGHLQISSEVGAGTTVRIFLPRAREAVVPLIERGDTALPTGHEAILLVDDNADMRDIARRHLTALGYQVVEAANGPAALLLLRQGNKFALLFTDISMPGGLTGYQLVAMARQMQPGLKVLFTTGFDWRGQQEEIAGLGPMLHKPYRKRELAATAREALDA